MSPHQAPHAPEEIEQNRNHVTAHPSTIILEPVEPSGGPLDAQELATPDELFEFQIPPGVHPHDRSIAVGDLDRYSDNPVHHDTAGNRYTTGRKHFGIDNGEARQKIIVELYDKFFKTAFPKVVEKLGIVYTPVEVVDFIIRSVADVLKSEFDRELSDENIHILDPFTGTGTFITRLIQTGLISPEALDRKYRKELHANEIVLLAYYIASINIENAYHENNPDEAYKPFEGICLTDTFQLGEGEGRLDLDDGFVDNTRRVKAQRKAPLRVIFGNPPYSVGQRSANDNAQNQSYPNWRSAWRKPMSARAQRPSGTPSTIPISKRSAGLRTGLIRKAESSLSYRTVAGSMVMLWMVSARRLRRNSQQSMSSIYVGTSAPVASFLDAKAERYLAPAAAHPSQLHCLSKIQMASRLPRFIITTSATISLANRSSISFAPLAQSLPCGISSSAFDPISMETGYLIVMKVSKSLYRSVLRRSLM